MALTLKAQSTIALYTELHAKSRLYTARAMHVCRTTDRRHKVLSTPDRPLSLFISHSPTVGVPWRNFPCAEFGTKFLREVLVFLEKRTFL